MTLALIGLTGHDLALAAPAEVATVVIHVTDYASVSANVLAEAQKEASKVYTHIGVRLVWMGGHAATATSDGAFHVDVNILSAVMTARGNAPVNEFGRACRAAKLAYIHYDRVANHALKTHGTTARTLAFVLAHEVGHLLLPESSHSRFGLMRAEWGGAVVDVPHFMPAQAATIRSLLAAAD